MKIKYEGTATLRSKGITFEPGAEEVVSKEIGEYLLATFTYMFKDVTPAPKKATKKTKETTE